MPAREIQLSGCFVYTGSSSKWKYRGKIRKRTRDLRKFIRIRYFLCRNFRIRVHFFITNTLIHCNCSQRFYRLYFRVSLKFNFPMNDHLWPTSVIVTAINCKFFAHTLGVIQSIQREMLLRGVCVQDTGSGRDSLAS